MTRWRNSASPTRDARGKGEARRGVTGARNGPRAPYHPGALVQPSINEETTMPTLNQIAVQSYPAPPPQDSIRSIYRILAQLEDRNDPDELADADGALWDVILQHGRQRAAGRRSPAAAARRALPPDDAADVEF